MSPVADSLCPGKQGAFSPLPVSRMATFPLFSEFGNLLPKSDGKIGFVFIVWRSQQFLYEAMSLSDFFQVDLKEFNALLLFLSRIWDFRFV